MKKRLLLVIAAASLLAVPAFADSVFMLQFGSFESQAEADSHLTELKSKHSDLIGSLPTSIRTISLPPDNLTVYRTQAGPVTTRGQAQAVCSQFAATGDECYVVETAMIAGSGAPVGTEAINAPTQPGTALPMPAPTPAPAPAMAALPESAPQPMPPQAAASTLIQPTPQFQSAPSTSTQPMEDELAAASANQQAQQQAIAATPAQAPAKHSVWWHLDPFSKSMPSAPSVAAPAAAIVSAPVEAVVSAPAPSLPSTASISAPAPMMAPPAPLPSTAPLAAAAPVIITAPTYTPPVAPAPIPQQPMQVTDIPPSMMHLPPPPLPLKGETIPTMAAQPQPMPQPIGVMPMQQAPGNVRVGEAQRVPLSQENIPPAMPAMVAPVPAPTAVPIMQPAVSLHPSSTIGQKTLWAQMGMFADAQAALAFWENYRQAHPDFPVVRVRIAAPYMAQQHGDLSVALRVGPFARPEFVRNLCSTVASNLHCGMSTDLGIAANPYGANAGYLPDSRYHR